MKAGSAYLLANRVMNVYTCSAYYDGTQKRTWRHEDESDCTPEDDTGPAHQETTEIATGP